MTGAIPAQTVISGLSAFAQIAYMTPRQGFLAEEFCAGILKDMEVRVCTHCAVLFCLAVLQFVRWLTG